MASAEEAEVVVALQREDLSVVLEEEVVSVAVEEDSLVEVEGEDSVDMMLVPLRRSLVRVSSAQCL